MAVNGIFVERTATKIVSKERVSGVFVVAFGTSKR